MNGNSSKKLPFFITIPHSGEKVPDFCQWLKNLPEEILMCDVDRFVDRLYEPAIHELKIPYIKTEWHRYAADLNRVPEDVDCTSVIGNPNKAGMHNRGFHWVVTTYNHQLMKEPMTQEMHSKLVDLIYQPFHQNVKKHFEEFKKQGHQNIFHVDAHSMPSKGTNMHRDPGEYRADIVISDCGGKSTHPDFMDLVMAAYLRAGFKVRMNWPYLGGRVSEQYGAPARGQHAVQVEMNRALYMDEVTKQFKANESQAVQAKVKTALQYIEKNLPALIEKLG